MSYQYPFLDPALPLRERVQDIISRLTIEEKAGFIPTGNHAVERLGIPAFGFGAEGAHGFVDRGGSNTTFPQTIGLASGWDRELLRKVGEIAAIEARVFYKAHERRGGLAVWSPTVDMERDPRWGRTEEGYGEDPFLAGELSSAYIRGAQGDDPFYLRVSCGPKHFFANNNERNRANCSCSIPPRVMREYYLAPFKAAIHKARAVSLMTAYNELNGIPMMLHPLLNEVVKNEWGIEGNLVTDGGDFLQTVSAHNYFETHAETLAAALKNGADSMTDDDAKVIEAVNEALEKKLITEAEIDEHLKRILAVRFRFGSFDPPGKCPYDSIDESYLMKDEYREVSREAVRKSAVLLKNDGNMLPLCPGKVKGTVAVIGPLADTLHLDWYSGNPAYLRTPLEGLRDLFGGKAVHACYRDIVSFTAEDGRPLVLTDTGNEKGKLLSAGSLNQSPARFYLEDWGWGAQTLMDTESGLYLESPYWRREAGGSIENEQSVVAASGKSTLTWFGYSTFNLVPQEDGFVLIRTFDNRRIAVPPAEGQVLLHDDPAPCAGELFRMKLERDGLANAAAAAEKADQVIIIAGSNPMINGRECTDRPSLALPPCQEELIRKTLAVNTNVALVLISGYPFTCGDIAKQIPAILWIAPGIQETGNGLADILGGSYSPAGRLPLTWYENESQLPSIMEYDIISAGTTYQYFTGNVLYPFGHGLSYSSFEYSGLTLDKTTAGEAGAITVSFNLKNSGAVTAEEVPQLYVNFSGSAYKRPLKTLKGFDRVSLTAGEERRVSFSLPVEELAIWDSYNARFCVETGVCTVMVGASSADIRLSGRVEINGEKLLPRKVLDPIYAERFDDYKDCFLHEKRGSAIPAVFNNYDENCVNRCEGGWIRFSSLDFGSLNLDRFSAVAQGAPGSLIEIRLDAPGGALAGVAEVPNTGDVSFYELSPASPRRLPVWAYTVTQTEKLNGIHDLYLVLRGKTAVWRFAFGQTSL